MFTNTFLLAFAPLLAMTLPLDSRNDDRLAVQLPELRGASIQQYCSREWDIACINRVSQLTMGTGTPISYCEPAPAIYTTQAINVACSHKAKSGGIGVHTPIVIDDLGLKYASSKKAKRDGLYTTKGFPSIERRMNPIAFLETDMTPDSVSGRELVQRDLFGLDHVTQKLGDGTTSQALSMFGRNFQDDLSGRELFKRDLFGLDHVTQHLGDGTTSQALSMFGRDLQEDLKVRGIPAWDKRDEDKIVEELASRGCSLIGHNFFCNPPADAQDA